MFAIMFARKCNFNFKRTQRFVGFFSVYKESYDRKMCES